MAVNLSMLAGAGAQFFTDSGVPLTGGLIYTYAAGTTTPQATYTTISGGTAHANPIVLDSAGRVPSGGEIWLTDAVAYKFVLKTSTAITIATYDNVTGNAGGVYAAFAASSGSSLVGYIQAGTGPVATTVQSKLRESVSVKDFGAVCNGTTDDTAAVQAAVNYCITNNRDLSVPGLCKLTASINIDRKVDGVIYDNYFTIFTDSGGGFYVSTAINLFSSSLAYTIYPVTQCIKFQNLIFQASVNTLAAYVLDGNKFLRTQFNGCTFSRIRCLTTTQYTQTIYFFNCNMRRFSGIFYNCTNVCYDIKFMGNMVESGDHFALMGSSTFGPHGCCFIGNLIEGMNQYAIQYGAATALAITGNYFEANGIDIDGRTLGGTTIGAAFIGNHYAHSPEVNPYGVLWGTCSGCVSLGNYGYSNINNLLPTSNVQINDSTLNANTSNYFAEPNSGYGEGPYSPVFRGSSTTNYTYTVASAKFTKNGKQITFSFRGTMTSTAINATEKFYIPSLLPYAAFEAGNLVGSVQIVAAGGTVYDSQLIMLTTTAVVSTGNVIPSNVVGDVFTVRGYFTFYTDQVY